MTSRWQWSVGVLVFVLVAVLSPQTSVAQGDGPRAHWKGMLVHTNLLSLTYMNASANVNPLDPALTMTPDAGFTANLVLLGYSRSFPLFGTTAVGSILAPMGGVQGSFTDPVSLEPMQDSTRGFGDPILHFDVNLYGTPAMRNMPALMRYEPRITVDLAMDVVFPIGQYDEDSPVNLGQNRWYGRVGLPIMINLWNWVPGKRTTLEIQPIGWFFGDNDDYLGLKLETKPLFELEGHLTRDITTSLWASLDVVWYYGGKPTIDGETGDNLNDVALGFTLGYQITNNLTMTAGYTTTIVDNDPGDLDLGVFRFSIVYGWHRLLEGIARLQNGQ